MNEQDKIDNLKMELRRLQEMQSRCKHYFDNPIYDPETVKEGYGLIQDGAGSDPHWSYAGYRDVQKDRWSRKCVTCGKKEYTYAVEPIISDYKPKFG